MTNYVGPTPKESLGDQKRYFYALRKTTDGELYFTIVDMMDPSASIVINNSGDTNDDYTEFSINEDFFEGRDVYHNLTYPNLVYEQYRWDDKYINYYLDTNGNLTARIGQIYSYPAANNA